MSEEILEPRAPRRRFLANCVRALLALVALIAVVSGIGLLFPSVRKRFATSNTSSPFQPICTVESLPPNEWQFVKFETVRGDWWDRVVQQRGDHLVDARLPHHPIGHDALDGAEHERRELHGVDPEVEQRTAPELTGEVPVCGVDRTSEPEISLHQQRLADDFTGEVVAGLPDPGLASHAQPFVVEQRFLFEFVEVAIGVAERRQRLRVLDRQH